jgi:non-specific protein-tyrosine kinase
MVDGVVLVTRLGRTTRERVRRAQAAIRRVNATIIGVVPNHAGKGADRDYRYGYKYAGSHKKGDTPADIDADTLLATAPAPATAPPVATPPHTQFREPPPAGTVGDWSPGEPRGNGAPKHEAPLDEPYSAPGWSGS